MAGALHAQSPEEAVQFFGGLRRDGVFALGGEGVNRRGPSGPMAFAVADEEGGLITADDPAVIHRLLTLVAGAGRDLV
ncbi:MAG: hypothetical protein ACKO8K_01700, partial [Candidatus Limnocylindrus sp.]